MDRDWGFVGEFDDVEQRCTMIPRVRGKRLCREKPVDFEFIRTFFEGELLQHHRPAIRDPSRVDAQA
jgi:hypothetical protein